MWRIYDMSGLLPGIIVLPLRSSPLWEYHLGDEEVEPCAPTDQEHDQVDGPSDEGVGQAEETKADDEDET